MKVVVVTGFTPTPENRGGISALIYSLLRFRPRDIEVKIFSLNLNKIDVEEIRLISERLQAEIDLIEPKKTFWHFIGSKWSARLQKISWKALSARDVVTNNFLKVLSAEVCDYIVLYPFYVSTISDLLPNQKFVILGPDSEVLNRARRLMEPFRMSSKKMMIDDFIYLQKHIATEKLWGKSNISANFVGWADYKCYRDVTGNRNGHFMLHPYVKYKEKLIDFMRPKLKVIIPGNYDMYYHSDVDKMIPSLLANKDFLLQHFEFTFLGKRWSPIDEQLKKDGFKCKFKRWVEDYAEELVQHDIQITPISLGTGTKGKVLDAAVNGLLVIGSDYALENVCVRHLDSCVLYKDASEIGRLLEHVALNRERYQKIAEKGRTQVLRYHDPVTISERFFRLNYNLLCK